MSTRLVLALFTATLAVHSAAHASDRQCADQAKFFRDGIKKRISIAELAGQIKLANPSVVFLGEFHTDDTALSYPYLFKNIKKELPKLDCLAFEAEPNPEGVRRAPWKALAELAKEKYGMSSHLVDGLCGEGEEDKSDDFLQVSPRNRCMAANLQALLAQEKCHQILMINGAFHLQANAQDGRPGIPARLKAAGIPVYSIFALDLSKGNKKAHQSSLDAWVWPKGPKEGKSWSDPSALEPLCKDVPGEIGENYAFLTQKSKLAGKVPITQMKNSAAWDQFDAVMMLGCPAKEQCE